MSMTALAGYADQAANERTFLAWVRTGIAIMSFGLVVERFDLFIQALIVSGSSDAPRLEKLREISARLSWHEGIALMVGGGALILVQAFRFERNKRLLDDAFTCSESGVSIAMVSALPILLVLVFTMWSVLR